MGSWQNAGRLDGYGKKLFSSHRVVSHWGHPWSLPTALFTKKKTSPKVNPASNINQPVYATGQSASHVV